MTTGDVKRKLTAIFSADVEGYSRLMEEDELATIETLTSHKEIMRKMIRQYRGRVVDSTGDNLLAEFASVVDAVQCAVEVQQVLNAKNETLPENRRMYFRIGINLGDVVEEGERIYGDGVNVAARVESLAEGGGISISGTAYDQLGKKLPLGYEYLGEQSVKNIEKPVRVYRILTEAEAAGKVIGEVKPKTKQLRGAAIGGIVVLILVAGALAIWNFYLRPPFEPASVEKMAFPLPDKPSIAVLPFVNMSKDQSDEYIADGLSENIISSLSKIPDMLVIARNSTFVYKGKAVKVSQVAEEVGVQYVLEGSVQKSGDSMRVTAQLVDAIKGHHLWSERYDRNTKDFFAVQDDITRNIVIALQVELTEGEQARISHTTENLEAWGYATKAFAIFQHYKKEKNARARELFKKAIELDPNYAFAWLGIAWTHFIDFRYGFSESRGESLKRSIEATRKAAALDDTLPEVHSSLGVLYLAQGQYEKAIAEGRKSIALGPSDATSHILLALTLNHAGRFEEAIFHAKKAMRLSPYYPTWYLNYLGNSYLYAKEYDKAIETLKKSLERSKLEGSQVLFPLVFLTQYYVEIGEIELAKAHAAEVLKVDPSFSLENWKKTRLYKDPAQTERHLSALRKAGLPETPPLPLPDKPSIAVLPFVNMSGDPEQEYFSDGITEQIISSISKLPRLFVISRTSSFKYKGKAVDVKQVGRELGVKNVLEGSVQRSGDRLRITAQLIDAMTGKHLWAERYDRDFKDIFALQDEITMKVMLSLAVKLTEGERLRLGRRSTDNLKALEKLFEAVPYLRAFNIESNVTARHLIEEAIAIDPKFVGAYDALACTHFMDVHLGSSKSPRKSLAQATKLLQKAISLDVNYALAYSHLCQVYALQRQYEKAIAEGEKAVALNPNSDDALVWLGMAMDWTGRSEEAIALYKKAMRLSPFPPSYYYLNLGHAYRSMERYKEAITEYNKALHLTPKNVFAFRGLAICYGLSGQEEEARAAAAELLKIRPNFCIRHGPGRYKNPADKEIFDNALRKAGLPDCPPRISK